MGSYREIFYASPLYLNYIDSTTFITIFHAFSVNFAICKHYLKDASYNDKADLSDKLDAAKDIEDSVDLIKELLAVKEFEHIWGACHGGSDPPMNLLFYLSDENCTLETFRSFAKSDKKNRFRDLIELVDKHEDCFGKRLNTLDFKLLIAICQLIRAKPHPTSEQARPRWKRLASTANLSDAVIDRLDAPTSRVTEGLTMTFFKFVTSRYPDQTVAWLANGLKNIGRHDLLKCKDFEIFYACKEKRCIVIS